MAESRKDPTVVERALREQLQALDRAYYEISRALAAPVGLEEVARVIAEQARIIAGAELSAVGLGDESDQLFTFWGSAGWPPDVSGTLPCPPRPVGLLGLVKRGGKVVRLGYARQHPAARGTPPGHPEIRSFIGLPIRHDATVLGHLFLANKRGAREFSETDECTLLVLAERAGIALEIARLRQVEQRERLRLVLLAETGRVFAAGLDVDTTIAEVVRLPVPDLADFAVAYLLEDDRLRPVGAAHRDPGKLPLLLRLQSEVDLLHAKGSTTVQALETRKPILVPEYTQAMLESVIVDPELRELSRGIFPRPVMSAMFLPFVARGHGLGVVILARPETDRRYDESDLGLAEELVGRLALAVDNALLYGRTAEALRARDSILAIVAHDLRSPLAAIHLSADLLSQACPPEPEDSRKRLTTIKRSAERINRLIEDLVQATLIEGGRLSIDRQPQDPSTLVEEVRSAFASMAAQKTIRLETSAAPDVGEVLCDHDRIVQVLSNLVDNSIKFAPPETTIFIEAATQGAFVRLSVKDQGPGIPKAQVPHIFDRYWKGAPSGRHGAGLGLYIARGIVTAHGGRIWVESVEGLGSTFSFTLPTAPEAPPPE